MDSKALSLSGSKSVINRILMMALYHDIEVCLSNFNRCNDTREMLKIYDVLGKEYQLTDTDLAIKNNPPKIPADIF
ncbi:MAG: hypothetical protein FWG20_07185, partial [Candidatus Cloacimonetes bacterium]|nr:hypothetical protein [Candidatus Cloacimonadota bacterium]